VIEGIEDLLVDAAAQRGRMRYGMRSLPADMSSDICFRHGATISPALRGPLPGVAQREL